MERGARNIRTTRLLLVLFAATLLLAPGCYYDNEQALYPDSFCDTTMVTWSLAVQPIIQGECAIPDCHVPGIQAPDLSSYTGVKTAADNGSMRGVVVNGDPIIMPPTGRLPKCRQETIRAWLDAGAPDN
ncbi:MAG: hypothetical protein IPI81_05855 [Flavobacteriales bacterium]|nr:hypothetical protein [Flavobacteriales bacterium]MCC6938650.1 hypothetical protein [Flavobacteriales bacterium]